ncbi:MAG: 50S ribosomal protein L37ae [Candidatus Nezhaarchaeales archaeon]
MGRTKVVSTTGRFKARYGSTIRKRVREVEEKLKASYTCPSCLVKGRLKRVATGIWHCLKCGKTYAGGAYTPQTIIGEGLAEGQGKR